MRKYRDNRKGYSNRGTGRIQFLHFFKESHFVSVFREGNVLKRREFILSPTTLNRNVFISNHRLESIDPNKPQDRGTLLTLNGVLDDKIASQYGKLSIEELKQRIIHHYLLEFVTSKNCFPNITINYYVSSVLDCSTSIKYADIPTFDNSFGFDLKYHAYDPQAKDYSTTGNTASFTMTVFRLAPTLARRNFTYLTSKGQIATSPSIVLQSLPINEIIENTRFLILLSSDYLDRADTDSRGNLLLRRATELKQELIDDLLPVNEEFIDLDGIEEYADRSLIENYPVIRSAIERRSQELDRLRKMFLLDKETLDTIKISSSDSEERILEKAYAIDSKKMAQRDAEIKRQIDDVRSLDPTAKDYLSRLASHAENVVKAIPLQNRTVLSHYVARRKLVLELFQKTLEHSIMLQEEGERNIDESILHNIIFQQHSNDPSESDLWLINEEFIYFDGTSESRLEDISIGYEKLLREELTAEEAQHLGSLGENRLIKRPDILLFPAEGKCIIIELKNPKVNLSDCLTEINRYASLIFGFSKSKFQIRTFYGYLIGESIDSDDVRDQDSDFREAPSFGYLFRPNKPIVSKYSQIPGEGSLYTEVVSYLSLLKRAKVRNQVFIERLLGKNEQ
jgi:hypothetical protein